MRVLIIDPDEGDAARMEAGLRRHGFLCDASASGAGARDMIATVDYAAVILDPALRDGDGLDLLRAMRQRRPGVPVLVVGGRADPRDSIAALDAGADDHLAAPADPDELAARLRAVLRRGRTIENAARIGDLSYDPQTLELSAAGRTVILSARERQLLALLMQGGGRLVTKHYAEDQLFGHSAALGSNAIEVYAHRLRRRLRGAGSAVRVETVRGVGYLLRVDGTADQNSRVKPR